MRRKYVLPSPVDVLSSALNARVIFIFFSFNASNEVTVCNSFSLFLPTSASVGYVELSTGTHSQYNCISSSPSHPVEMRMGEGGGEIRIYDAFSLHASAKQ